METLSKEELAVFQEFFDIIDTEGDGSITYRDLNVVLNALGGNLTEAEVQAMINQGDIDGNGSIEFPEFTYMLLNIMANANQQDDLREVFRIYDKENTGFISPAELRTIYVLIGLKLSDEEVDELIREADIDQDGVLVFEEFVTMMTVIIP